MLDTTLATEFVPGTNRRGQVAGANWTFLLPSRELELVVCLGLPAAAELTTLSGLGQVAIVVPEAQAATFRPRSGAYRSSSVGVLVRGTGTPLPLPDNSADLVVLGEGEDLRNLRRDSFLQSELSRVLKRGGLLYVDLGGPIGAAGGKQSVAELATSVGPASTYWVTPMTGAIHTAVPIQQQDTIDYFLENELHTPSITQKAFRSVKSRLKQRPMTQSAGDSSDGDVAQPIRRSRPPYWPILRVAGEGILRSLASLERVSIKKSRRIRRHGAFLGLDAANLAEQIPHYLSALAGEAGIDVDEMHWGLVARGDYSSRKVLFYLFAAPEKTGGELSLAYVVKMVRDPIYNPRLENEYRALSLLQEKEVAAAEILPRVAFWGYHQRLAILGETAVGGTPFRERTSFTVDCPYLHTALDWLGSLGTETADPTVVKPQEVAEVLQTLLDRFIGIYHLTQDQQAFLEEQVDIVARSVQPFPVVFQHGDPGTWNALALGDERVIFLDWEAAESQGLPLWDLFYFMRSYCMGAARAQGIHDRLQGFAQLFLSDTKLSRLMLDTIERHRARIGLEEALVEPLFYTCWLHRALKESTRLAPSKVDGGHYVNLLRLCIERRKAMASGPLFPRAANRMRRFHSTGVGYA